MRTQLKGDHPPLLQELSGNWQLLVYLNYMRRTIEQERIWVNQKTNFHYIVRGIERTPPGTKVKIVECNGGIVTEKGILKDTVSLGLMNENGYMAGQWIAWSFDRDDLILFAIEHEWDMDEKGFLELKKSLAGDTAQKPDST